MTEPNVEPVQTKAVTPKNKSRRKDDRVTVISPAGTEYRTSAAEAARLNRTAGYKYA